MRFKVLGVFLKVITVLVFLAYCLDTLSVLCYDYCFSNNTFLSILNLDPSPVATLPQLVQLHLEKKRIPIWNILCCYEFLYCSLLHFWLIKLAIECGGSSLHQLCEATLELLRDRLVFHINYTLVGILRQYFLDLFTWCQIIWCCEPNICLYHCF